MNNATETEERLTATLNGIEYKQGKAPHRDKVFYNPGGDFIKCEMTVDDLREEVKRVEKAEAKRIAESATRIRALLEAKEGRRDKDRANRDARTPEQVIEDKEKRARYLKKSANPALPTKSTDTAVLAMVALKKGKGSMAASELADDMSEASTDDKVITRPAARLAIKRLLHNGLVKRVGDRIAKVENKRKRASRAYVLSAVGMAFLNANFKELAA